MGSVISSCSDSLLWLWSEACFGPREDAVSTRRPWRPARSWACAVRSSLRAHVGTLILSAFYKQGDRGTERTRGKVGLGPGACSANTPHALPRAATGSHLYVSLALLEAAPLLGRGSEGQEEEAEALPGVRWKRRPEAQSQRADTLPGTRSAAQVEFGPQDRAVPLLRGTGER